MSGGKVALHHQHVFEDFVGLGQEFDDLGDAISVVHSLCPVSVGKGGVADCCHGIILRLSHQRAEDGRFGYKACAAVGGAVAPLAD